MPDVTVSFEQSTHTVDEGDDVTVTVTLNADPERTVTVPLTATGQDGAGSGDYSGVSDQPDLPARGRRSRPSHSAPPRTRRTTTGSPSSWASGTCPPESARALSPSETIISITDDDGPSVTVTFENASYTVAEGNSVDIKPATQRGP